MTDKDKFALRILLEPYSFPCRDPSDAFRYSLKSEGRTVG